MRLRFPGTAQFPREPDTLGTQCLLTFTMSGGSRFQVMRYKGIYDQKSIGNRFLAGTEAVPNSVILSAENCCSLVDAM